MPWVRIAKSPPQRQFADEPSGDAEWQALHREADKAYPALRAALLVVWGTLQAAMAGTVLKPLHILGTEAPVLTAYEALGPRTWATTMRPILTQTVHAGGIASAPALERLGITARFDLTNPRVFDAIERHTARAVREGSETTREGIRHVLHWGFEDGRTVPQMAQDMRAFVGLTPRQVTQVRRYREGLVEAGMKAQRVQELAEKRAGQLLRRRTMLIARTETITASAAGQHLLWEQAQVEGLLPPEMRRFPVLTPDDRLCPQCRLIPGMNLKGRRINEPFDTPYGPIMFPAFHPACRCSTRLKAVPDTERTQTIPRESNPD